LASVLPPVIFFRMWAMLAQPLGRWLAACGERVGGGGGSSRCGKVMEVEAWRNVCSL
jgi:hypothetical protein